MYERLVPDVLTAYGVQYDHVLSVQKGYRNEIYPIVLTDGLKIQLTFYKSEPGMDERIQRADTVALYASEKGLPTRTRYDQRTLTLISDKRTVYTALYYYLPGKTIAWEAYTQAHIKQLGKTMSDLHAALQDFESIGQVSVVDETSALLKRMQDYFQQTTVIAAMKEKLQLSLHGDLTKYQRLLDGLRQLPSQQLHMDFVRGNIVFENEKITGILDFEKTGTGPVVLDIARTLSFLLVDCKYKTEVQVRKYFLQSGYHKRGAASLDFYPTILELCIELFLIHDFYKFLRHTPYESLPHNEHFIRTVSLLTRSGVLHYT